MNILTKLLIGATAIVTINLVSANIAHATVISSLEDLTNGAD